MDEFLDVGDRDREPQIVGEGGVETAAGHADHLAALIEERPARVAGVDRRVGLQEELALEAPAPIGDPIPCVTDRSKPSGLPTAKTESPALTSSALPRITWLGFKSAGSGSLSKARSKNGFKAMISTSSIRRRLNPPGAFMYKIAETRVSPWMTWALVIA